MRRLGDSAWRALVAAAAVGGSVGLITLDLGVTATIVAVAIVLVLGGAIADRTWAAGVPFVGAAGYCLWLAATEGANLNDGSSDTTWAMMIVLIGACAFAASAGLLLGLVLRMRAQSVFSPKNDANGLSLKLPISR